MASEGLTKSAILMMSLGEDEAAAVFKHLDPREVQKIGFAMASLKGVSRDAITEVIEEFCQQAEDQAPQGSDDYVRNVLRKSLGDEHSSGLINRVMRNGDASGIESLKWMDSRAVSELIGSEHPQIIATILVHLERDQASEIVALLEPTVRQSVMLRIATLDRIQPAALQELNEVLTKLLAGGTSAGSAEIGGVRTAAEIINLMPGTNGTALLDGLKETDAELAQKIVDEMFVWESLLDLEDKAIQLVLREVQSEGLIVALKGSSQALRDKVFSNMSQRAGDALKEELEEKGMVRVSEVEAQQKEILTAVRRLADQGQINLGGGGEAYV